MKKTWYQIKIVLVFFILSKIKYIENKDVKPLLNAIILKSDKNYRTIEGKKLDNLRTECYNIISEYEGEEIDTFYHGQAVLAKTILEKLS